MKKQESTRVKPIPKRNLQDSHCTFRHLETVSSTKSPVHGMATPPGPCSAFRVPQRLRCCRTCSNVVTPGAWQTRGSDTFVKILKPPADQGALPGRGRRTCGARPTAGLIQIHSGVLEQCRSSLLPSFVFFLTPCIYISPTALCPGKCRCVDRLYMRTSQPLH